MRDKAESSTNHTCRSRKGNKAPTGGHRKQSRRISEKEIIQGHQIAHKY